MRTPWHRSPSLSSLCCFEAAARHLSFTTAAVELCVTQAAVSRQVREVERALGKPLFTRLHRRVELTVAGQELAREVGQGLQTIARAIQSARGETRLRVSVVPAIATRWLAPRFREFLLKHPDVALDLEATELLREVGRDADVALRYLDEGKVCDAPGAEPIVAVSMFPVCSPAFRVRMPDLPTVDDLLDCELLHEDDGGYWSRWLSHVGRPGSQMRPRIRTNDQTVALEAAIAGQGVALADALLAFDDLKYGRLIRLHAAELPAGMYWLIANHGTTAPRGQRQFCDWLKTTTSRAGLSAGGTCVSGTVEGANGGEWRDVGRPC